MGTLIELEPPAPRLAALRGIDQLAAEQLFAEEIRYYRAHMLEPVEPLRERCAAILGVTVDDLHELLRFRVFPDVQPTLDALRAARVRTVVASNWDASLPEVLASYGLRFDGVICSGMVGVAKPDRRLFDAALELAGVSAAETLHVGDSYEEDVVGARAAGIEPVLLRRRFPGSEPESQIRDVRVITTLSNLAAR